VSPAEEVSSGAPNSSTSPASGAEESGTEVHDSLLEIDPIPPGGQDFQTRIKNVRVFVASELKRMRNDGKKVAASASERREIAALAAAPGCPIKKRLFNLGLLGFDTRPRR
jgi:hypothetical protein